MKNCIVVSAFCGVLFAVPTFLVLIFIAPEIALQLSVAAGLLFALLLFPYLVIHQRVMNKKYARFEATLTSPVFYKTNGNTRHGKRVKNGNLYFCEDGIVFASLEEKPFLTEKLLLENIEKCEFEFIYMRIHTKDGSMLQFQIADAVEARNVLKEKGWAV